MSSASRTVDLSPRGAALIAGFGYLGLLVFSSIALSLVDGLIVRGDAAATISNITESASSFRLGIASYLVALALDSVIVWGLYIFFKPAGSHLSLIAAWFGLVYVAIAVSTLVTLLAASQLLGTAGGATGLGRDQLASLAMLAVFAYELGFKVGFFFFGLHILCLGVLVLRTGYVPRLLGVLLVAAAAGYFIDSFGNFVSTSYGDDRTLFIVFVAVPALVAEYALAVWLLIKGGRSGQQTMSPATRQT